MYVDSPMKSWDFKACSAGVIGDYAPGHLWVPALLWVLYSGEDVWEVPSLGKADGQRFIIAEG